MAKFLLEMQHQKKKIHQKLKNTQLDRVIAAPRSAGNLFPLAHDGQTAGFCGLTNVY